MVTSIGRRISPATLPHEPFRLRRFCPIDTARKACVGRSELGGPRDITPMHAASATTTRLPSSSPPLWRFAVVVAVRMDERICIENVPCLRMSLSSTARTSQRWLTSPWSSKRAQLAGGVLSMTPEHLTRPQSQRHNQRANGSSGLTFPLYLRPCSPCRASTSSRSLHAVRLLYRGIMKLQKASAQLIMSCWQIGALVTLMPSSAMDFGPSTTRSSSSTSSWPGRRSEGGPHRDWQALRRREKSGVPWGIDMRPIPGHH